MVRALFFTEAPILAAVAAEITKGRSYKETAEVPCISVKTLKSHIASVYRKTATGDKPSPVLLLREGSGTRQPE